MYNFHLHDMADNVRDELGLNDEQRETVLRVLNKYWTDKIALVWTEEDVLSECPGLTDDEANKVLWEVHNSQDASYGVSWDTIRQNAVVLFGDKALESGDDED